MVWGNRALGAAQADPPQLGSRSRCQEGFLEEVVRSIAVMELGMERAMVFLAEGAACVMAVGWEQVQGEPAEAQILLSNFVTCRQGSRGWEGCEWQVGGGRGRASAVTVGGTTARRAQAKAWRGTGERCW